MAMFELEGYCPANAIEVMARQMRGENLISELGSRHLWMVYPDGCTEGGAYIKHMLFSEVGMDVAVALRTMVPECEYPTTMSDAGPIGKKIVLHDVQKDDIPECEVVLGRDGYIVGLSEGEDSVAMYIARDAA